MTPRFQGRAVNCSESFPSPRVIQLFRSVRAAVTVNSQTPPWTPGPRISELPGAKVIDKPLHAVVLGEGPSLVLVHGLLVSGEMYAPVVPALAEHHRLIVPDLRGMGASRILPGPYTPVQQAADLAELLRRLDVSRAAVLGTSQGGPVSMQLLHDHSDVVGRLILVCTYAYNLESIREKIEGSSCPGSCASSVLDALAR